MSTDAPRRRHPHATAAVRHTHAHGHSAHAHDFAVPDLPEAVDIFDTILRDGSQQEGLSLTVDDKLRVAEQLDHLGVTFIEGGWPGRQPQGRRVLRAGQEGADAEHRHAGGLRLHPAGRREAGDRRRPGQPRGRRGTGRLHRGQVVGPPRRRGAAHLPRRGGGHGGRLGALPARSTTCGSSSTRSTSSTATGATPTSPCPSWRRPRRRAPRRWCCATPTAARCPTTWGRPWPTCGSAPARSSASTATTTPAARWPTRWWPCRPGRPRCRAASTATASGRATRTCRRPSPTCRSSSTSAPSRPTAWSG